MKTSEILRAWRKILKGDQPSLSVEITRECPLSCPGCYAFDDAHLGGGMTLRGLHDRKGQELIDGVVEIADRLKPLHLSIVGGDPLVRYREIELMIPLLLGRGIHVQLVTSAFRPLSPSWARLPHMNIVVSIDGLQPEHDVRRAPATYDRILKNIAGQKITIHCTITGQMMKQPGYLKKFLRYWTPKPEIREVWFSLFTPQVGDPLPEMLQPDERQHAIADMLALRNEFPKLDMPAALIRQFASPPCNPKNCVFALTTQVISADLKTKVLSIRRKSGLRFVRVRRINGLGSYSRAQARRYHSSGSHLQSLSQNWPVWPNSVRTDDSSAGSRGSTAGAPRRMKRKRNRSRPSSRA
jgi:sulfatase maturation enzyme AslB (radical SAM superfamily)